MRFVVSIASMVFLLFATPPAGADGGFRCGRGRIVRNGETADDVAQKCGPADAVRTWSETRTEWVGGNGHAIERQVLIVFDEWKYDLGRNRLVRYFTFANGRLAKVETGRYGE